METKNDARSTGPGLADLVAARDRARNAFHDSLKRLEAAARTPEGVSPAMEAESALARAMWKKAEADLTEFRKRAG